MTANIARHINDAANAYGEDALGPIFCKPLVIETDLERWDREEREWIARDYEAAMQWYFEEEYDRMMERMFSLTSGDDEEQEGWW